MKNMKKRKIGKTILIIVATILCLGLVAGVGGALYEKVIAERNPDNLLKVDDTYIKSQKTNYGLEIDVDDNGVIKLEGNTSANEELVVQTVTLPAGTYTISGIEKPNIAKMTLAAKVDGNSYYAGLSNDTFTLEAEKAVTIVINVQTGEGDEKTIDYVNRTIKPVLVKGEEIGDFYK